VRGLRPRWSPGAAGLKISAARGSQLRRHALEALGPSSSARSHLRQPTFGQANLADPVEALLQAQPIQLIERQTREDLDAIVEPRPSAAGSPRP